jgi:hypothetical protein
MTAAVLLFGSFFCLAFAAAVTVSLAAMAAAAVETAAATTAVSGSSYCFSSAVAEMASALAVMDAAAIITAAVAHHGITAVETIAETAVAANFFGNGPGGIFGCPSCHGSNPAMIETLKLFLPYFPLHIQNLIRMYLKLLEFMHTFEMIQNMMNHMDEYQALFQAFENMSGTRTSSEKTDTSSNFSNPLAAFAPILGYNSGFNMSDLSSMQNIMEGSDLADEFTYVEEPSGTGWYGS